MEYNLIMKSELILRLLENDELSTEEVNDTKDFLEDYLERKQEDFDEFSDVDELYSSLPLDKVEALEDLVAIGQPSDVKVLAVKKNIEDVQGKDSYPCGLQLLIHNSKAGLEE